MTAIEIIFLFPYFDIVHSLDSCDEGLTLETSAFRIPVRWSIYIINSVDNTKYLYKTPPPTQHHSILVPGVFPLPLPSTFLSSEPARRLSREPREDEINFARD